MSGSGAGGESEGEDSNEVDDTAEPCDFGGGLIEIADDGEPVESTLSTSSLVAQRFGPGLSWKSISRSMRRRELRKA